MYKVAEIGHGTFGLLSLLNPELDPVAFCDISDKKREDAITIAKFMKEKMQNVKENTPVNGYTDYQEMILKEKPDIVVISTPNCYHADMSVFALEHDAHVLVEKPMCISLNDCERMVDTVKKTGLKLAVNQCARTIKHFQIIFDRIKDGEIGTPHYVRAEYLHGSMAAGMEDPHISSFQDSVLLSGGSHAIDLVLGLMNEAPSTVFASGSKFMTSPNYRFNDMMTVLVKFPSGKTGYAVSNQACHRREMGMTFELYGTKLDVIQTYTFVEKGKDMSNYAMRFYGKDNERYSIKLDEIGKTQMEIDIGHGQGFYRQIENLLYAVKYDVKQPTMADVVDGAKTTSVGLMAEKSIVTGKEEHIPYWEPIKYKGAYQGKGGSGFKNNISLRWKLDDYQNNMLRDFVPLLSDESRKEILNSDSNQYHFTDGQDS